MERRDPDSPTRVGEVLADKYVLEELLGAGGMGEVYRAHNALAGRTVAIKVLKSSLAKNREFVARFVREARAANIVRHPNVVDVLDVGQDAAGVPFIVQECLEGYDLAQHLHDLGGRLPVKAVLDLMIPVVDAVAAAHAKGVVHRDLKPDNVFLAKQSGKIVPKLLDFGISKMDVGETARLTAAEFTLGTPAYMSPEQIMGERNVDPRTDVWSLGVMLFEVLTGRLPFHAEEPRKLIVEIATEDVTPLAKVAPHVPQELSEAVARCLARKRELRFANAAELAKTLRAVRDLESVHTPAIAWVPPDPESVRTRARMLRAQTIAAPNSSPPPAADAEIGTEVSLEADLGGAKAAPEPEPEPEPELELEPEAELDAEPPRRSAIAAAPSRATPPAPRPPPPPVPQRRPGAASSVPELALDAPPPPRPASPPPPAAPSSSDAVSLDLDESGPSRHSRPSGRPSVASSPPASVGEGVNRVPVASASLRHSSGPPSRAPAPRTEHERAASTASSDDRSLYAGVVTASLVLVGAGLVLVANQLVLDVHPPASLVDVTPLAAAAAVVALLVGALASRAGYRAWLAAERSRALVAMAVAAMAFASCLQITRDIGRVGEAPASSAPR